MDSDDDDEDDSNEDDEEYVYFFWLCFRHYENLKVSKLDFLQYF